MNTSKLINVLKTFHLASFIKERMGGSARRRAENEERRSGVANLVVTFCLGTNATEYFYCGNLLNGSWMDILYN
jgi:hypothetical protein